MKTNFSAIICRVFGSSQLTLKSLGLDEFLNSKLKAIKQGKSEDEYGEDPNEFVLFDSTGGWFGLAEDEDGFEDQFGFTYGEMENQLPKYFDDLWSKIEKISRSSRDGEIIHNGIKFRYSQDPVNGIMIFAPTDWIAKNINKKLSDIR